MSENKTKPTGQSVDAFLNSIPAAQKRADGFVILEMMRRVTGMEPYMWGESIIGFGSYHYKYESGREGDAPQIGFSPRKQNLTLYIMPGLASRPDLAARLGKFKTSKSCLYINKLADVDLEVLEKLIRQAFSEGG
jgi:hypothetical protein